MTGPLTTLSREIARLGASLAAHLVAVRGSGTAASGFLWRDGLVVTAEEALEAETGLSVAWADGSEAPATLIGRDPSTDVALLRVEGTTPPPAPLVGGPAAVGELALALGRGPEGPLAALGIVGALGPAWRSLRGGRIDALIRLDLRLPRAAQGGLVADAEGRPFGMAVHGPRRSTLVIPAATLERTAAHLLAHGRIGRGWLGLGLQPVRLDGSGEPGLLVSSVAEDGPGRQAGLLQGDILLRLGGEPVAGMRGLMARLGPESIGRTEEIEIRRAGETRTAQVTIAERPAP